MVKKKKEVKVAEVIIEKDEPKQKYLTKEEALRFAEISSELRVSSLSREMQECKLKLLEKDLYIYQLTAQAEIEQFKKTMVEQTKQIEQAKEKEAKVKIRSKDFGQTIMQKHNISGGQFGYNPDTLEIITG